MKTRRHILKFAGAVFAALALASTSTYAGPGPQQVFRPVKDKAALSALRPGSHVAHECPHCGTISVSKVTKDHSHAQGFACPECKMKFEFIDAGGGKVRVGQIACVNSKTGKKMSAKVCASHH